MTDHTLTPSDASTVIPGDDGHAGIVPGTVYLVGAGPGDPGLLTRHGADALSRADVVVYDRLADNSMLALAPADAELIYVGKQAAVHAVPQKRINELLAEHALLGKCVVRLKGGDPFVFGRGGEEATHLRERGVPFIVVPGVSSAVAAPAYAGIPVTDRRYASSFAVITGHEDPAKPFSRVDWAGIAKGADTLVFLMALTNLKGVAERLVAEGRPAETPAAVIERGTTPGQRVVTGTLADIEDRVRTAGLHPPALIVVGEVVKLRDVLAWHDSQPLAGRRILVPRVRRRPSEIVRLLKAAGADTAEVPVLRSDTLPAAPDLLRRLHSAAWLVFTSPGGLDALLEQLSEQDGDIRDLGAARVAAVGPATAAHLRRHGLRVEHDPETPARFLPDLPDVAGATLLLIGEAGEEDHVTRGLVALGAQVDVMPVYRLAVDDRAPLPQVDEFDAVAFASSNTARRFLEAYPGGAVDGQYVVSIGPSTSATARSLGLRVDDEAAEASPAGVVSLIIERLGPASL
jgi:uroporphyrinogen III methyltransferase/synthase